MKRLLPLLLFLTALPAHAWTRAADHRIAVKSLEYAPPDLRLVIDQFRDEYLRGVEMEVDRATLRTRIEAEARAVVQMIRTNKPMVLVVQRLGYLSKLISEANNPRQGDSDYGLYFERRLARFPTVFYGLDRRFALGPYLDRTFARTAKFVPLMDEEYTRGNAATFDDRSTAFGVASVCYSHAVTDIANVQYFIWKEAGGNVRKMPQSVVLNGN
jgi:hypothetical protein